MSFINPLLLLGMLGVALPILAHILNKHEFQTTRWAAMQFLNRNVRVRTRQIKLKDLLLLILRCLVILLVAFALARPGVTGTGSSLITGEQRPGVVIALDASFSMQHGRDESRFDRAVKQARLIAEQVKLGDRVTLVMLAGDQDVVVRNMAYEPERFQAILETLEPVPEPLNLNHVPESLRALADEMDAQQKEIYLITDVQSRDWGAISGPMRDAFEQLGQGTSVFLVPVRGEAENLAITEFEHISGVLRRGSIARYRATVKNFGNDVASNVRVIGSVDGSQIDTKVIPRIAPDAEESVSLFVPLHNTGSQKISAELPDDVLPEDNIRRLVSVVREKVSVLCVDGSSGEAGALITAALRAADNAADAEAYSARTVSWLSFPAQNLEEVDVLIVTDVPEVTAGQAKQLEDFVRRGNGLIWFAGPNVNVAKWNEYAASEEGSLLPAIMGDVVNTDDLAGAGKPLERSISDHPVLQPLLSLPEDLFNETRFLKRLNVTPRASSGSVLTLAASTDPILLEQALGRGHVFMCTTTVDPAWNNMAATPVFPMLVQQMVNYLAGRAYEEPQEVGDALSLWYSAEPDASDAVFDSPSDEELTVPVRQHGKQFVALLDKADEAGYYTARVSVQSAGMPIAVNVNTRESKVACLPQEELVDAVKSTGITIISSESELVDAIEQARTSRSLWRVLLLAALIVLFVESILADRMASKRAIRSGVQSSEVQGSRVQGG
jgi:hypothetical protein